MTAKQIAEIIRIIESFMLSPFGTDTSYEQLLSDHKYHAIDGDLQITMAY